MEKENGQAHEKREFLTKVRCPVCGYIMPLMYTEEAECHGVYVSCKGRNCRNVFEVIIKNGQQRK